MAGVTEKQKLVLKQMASKGKSKEEIAKAANLTVPQVISLLGKLSKIGWAIKDALDGLWTRTDAGKQAMTAAPETPAKPAKPAKGEKKGK